MNRTKICTVCGMELPATTKYFYKNTQGKYGLLGRCKECVSLITRRLMVIVPYIPKDGYKICSKCNQELPATLEYFCKFKDGKNGLYPSCRECNKIISKIYYANNTEHCKEKQRAYAKTERGKEASRRAANKYHSNNKEKVNAYARIYSKTEKGRKAKLEGQKRYAKTEKGRITQSKTDARRRDMKSCVLFENPLPEEIEVDYHHINNLLIIPIPRSIHKLSKSGRNIEKHRKKCEKWIKKLYGLDVKSLILRLKR